MKILFIGGTGLISTAVSKVVVEQGHDLYLLNRGNRSKNAPQGANLLVGDIYDEEAMQELLKDHTFDVVVEWIAFTVDHIKRDERLFTGKTKQYVFISSASAYQKPLTTYPITEDVPLDNPYWEYSDNKRLCEEYLTSIDKEAFRVTIVRPSHTYDDDKIITQMHSYAHPYTYINRILEGKPVIILGDGTSLWTITHNTDFAKGFVPLLGNEQTYGDVYHITSHFTYTWNYIHELFCKELGKEPNIIHIPTDFVVDHAPFLEGELKGDKIWSKIFDNSKVSNVIGGYHPTVPYESIVPKVVKKYLDNTELQTIDTEFDALMDRIIEAYQSKK